MKTFIYAATLLAFIACVKQETSNTSTSTAASTTNAPSATSAAAEQVYPMTGTIISRDPAKNTINIDNQEVPGKMMPMKMSYEVRGANVNSLPPDGAAVVVNVHDLNGKYYLTDVKAQAKK